MPKAQEHRCDRCGQHFRPEPSDMRNRRYRVDTGQKPFRVFGHCARCLCVIVEYENTGTISQWPLYKLTNYVPTGEDNQPKGTEDMKTLYAYSKIVDGQHIATFGHRLAINSAGDWIMEEKGTGAVHVIARTEANEVMPYTVRARFMTEPHGKTYDFFARAGDWSVNDMLLSDDYAAVMKVVEVDVKSKQATKWLRGLKLSGTYISGGED